jgi:hypothetical protein
MMYLTKTLAAILVGAALSGCTTTEQANEVLATKFVGQSTDSFFLQYGPPSGSHQLNDGRVIYQWEERPRHYTRPSTSTAKVYGSTTYITTTPGATFDVQCQVRIIAKDGKVQEILSSRDTWGEWQTSRCHEIFGK